MIVQILDPATVVVTVSVVGATQEPRAHEVDYQPENGNRNGLGEANRYRREKAHDGFIANEERNHRENNRARKASEITQLTRTKHKASVIRVLACIHIGKCRN